MSEGFRRHLQNLTMYSLEDRKWQDQYHCVLSGHRVRGNQIERYEMRRIDARERQSAGKVC